MQELPKLPYPYDALEPYIDSKTMEIHHTKHHQTYINKLNLALEKYPDIKEKQVIELLKDSSIPEDIKKAVRNHGGGHFNHSLFWTILKKDSPIQGEIQQAINSKFQSFEKFKEEFSTKAANLFGSGWTWLVLKDKELEIITTPNQDSPICDNFIPILGLDLWEHAYYILYQNKRPEYIEAFFNVINWEEVNKRYKEATS